MKGFFKIDLSNKFIFLFVLIFSSIIKLEYVSKEWTKYEFNPVLGNNFTGTLFDPFVIKTNNTYKMYISWRPKGVIALSMSDDGIKWSELKIILNRGNSQNWNSIVNRASLIIKDGKYMMWYTGQHNGSSKIGYAFSEDGYNFTQLIEPILVPEYDYEKKSVMNPHVIYDNQQKLYKMWYSAGELYEPDVLCYAISKDGINWIKYKKNPIFIPNKNKLALDSYKIGGCFVIKMSRNYYLMFYIGYTDINTARIFIAKSNNGITNWKRSYEPIIKPSKKTFDEDACYKPSVLYNKKLKRWMLYYNGRLKNKEYIGYATNNNYKLFDKIIYLFKYKY